ncbi:MAG: Sodium/pantothenate symporter [Burkholderia sp.]|jgi:sodium/pantothenate symporter
MKSLLILAPIAVFLIVLAVVSVLAEKGRRRIGFAGEYFLGDRSLKGFVLAMTLVATYGSVSSFVSGPGIAWQLGLGWVVFAAPQIIAGFLLLGVAGKKMSVVSRAAGAITVIGLIRARYGDSRVSHFLADLLAVLMLVFFTTMMVGQFIGGAQIFSQAAGIGYTEGLLLFGAVTVFYTAFGGFRAVAWTDTVCAVLMLVGMFELGDVILSQGGGLEAVMQTVAHAAPKGPGSEGIMLSPTAGGALALPLLFSAWLLVGFGTLGLPQSAVRCMSYESTSDMRLAMIVSTVVCGALMIGMTLIGVLARGILDVPLSEVGGTTDAVIPYLIASRMDPVTAGITLIGPLAATMSTVSSLLLAASSSIVQDLILHRFPEAAKDEGRLRRRTRFATALLGVIALVLAVKPMDVVAWINLFAFGGLELSFLLPLIGGLFWKKANAQGALASVVLGIGVFLTVSIAKIPVGGFHAIVPGFAAAAAAFIAVSLASRPSPERSLDLFFPRS